MTGPDAVRTDARLRRRVAELEKERNEAKGSHRKAAAETIRKLGAALDRERERRNRAEAGLAATQEALEIARLALVLGVQGKLGIGQASNALGAVRDVLARGGGQ